MNAAGGLGPPHLCIRNGAGLFPGSAPTHVQPSRCPSCRPGAPTHRLRPVLAAVIVRILLILQSRVFQPSPVSARRWACPRRRRLCRNPVHPAHPLSRFSVPACPLRPRESALDFRKTPWGQNPAPSASVGTVERSPGSQSVVLWFPSHSQNAPASAPHCQQLSLESAVHLSAPAHTLQGPNPCSSVQVLNTSPHHRLRVPFSSFRPPRARQAFLHAFNVRSRRSSKV